MTALIYPFLALAAAGFTAALAVHVTSLLGATYPFEHFLKFLGLGVFVVFIPTIFVMNRLTREVKQKDMWRAALRGCPRWMRGSVWTIFGYAWIGFFAFSFLHVGAIDSEINKARSASAVILVFYLIPLSVLYSATQVPRFNESARCANGHRVSPLADFCEQCGARVASNAPLQDRP
jgi:hypothetical protein